MDPCKWYIFLLFLLDWLTRMGDMDTIVDGSAKLFWRLRGTKLPFLITMWLKSERVWGVLWMKGLIYAT